MGNKKKRPNSHAKAFRFSPYWNSPRLFLNKAKLSYQKAKINPEPLTAGFYLLLSGGIASAATLLA